MSGPFATCLALPRVTSVVYMKLLRATSPMRLPILVILAGLAACVEFPQLDANLDAAALDADFPRLMPLDPLLEQANALQTSGQISPASITSFDTRVASLTTRAFRLRGPVIDAATRARMRRGVAVPAAIR